MLTEAEYTELAGRNSVFAAMPADQVDRIRTEASLVDVPAGGQIFGDGDVCENFVVILRGVVRASKVSTAGRELLLYYVHPGEYCVITSGCLLGNSHYNARAIALEDATLVSFPRTLFEELLACNTKFRESVFELMNTRMSMLMSLVEEVAFHKLDRRLASLLLERTGNGTSNYVAATHQELAEDLGTSREIVSRILESLEAEGLVGLARRRVNLVDADRLRNTYLEAN